MAKPSCCIVLIAVTVTFAAPLCAQQENASNNLPLRVEKQGSFFVGGHDVHSETLSSTVTRAPSGTITVDQVYVRYQIPVGATGRPVTFIHGCCLTGKTWETTPDGRMGWDEYFVRRGRSVYVIDQASRGRSAANPSAINRVKLGKAAPDQLPPVSAVSHEEAWTIFRFGPEYQKVFPGLQFPLEAEAEFWKQMVPDWIESLPTPNPTVPALSALAQRLNGTVLVSHSQSGVYPFQTAAFSTKGVAGIVSIEPGACPAATDDMAPYENMPILVLFGDYVGLSPRWSPRLKGCREFVQAATKAGARAELVVLPEVGFHGNSHMLMQDRNSREIADWLLAWIDRHVEQER
jgi:pimeloyl-ACP methyl ester carboxylesterase